MITRTLTIGNTEITKPSPTKLRQLLREFKKDTDNTKAEDALFDYIDALAKDNETMVDYIVSINRRFEQIKITDTYDK